MTLDVQTSGIRRELGPWKDTKVVRELEGRMVGGFLGNS